MRFTVIGVLLLAIGCGEASEPGEVEPAEPAGASGAAGAASGGTAGAVGVAGSGAVSSGGAAGAGSAAGSAGGAGEAPDTYPIPDWPTASPESQGLDPVALDEAAQVAEELESYCLLVIRNGVLVSERYFNGGSATSTHPSWSIAKSYTSVLVGIALERGEIASIDQSVADYVPEWKADGRAAITIRHLLSMTSGLKWSAFQDYVSMAVFSQNHTQFATALELQDPPGNDWIYHNGGVQMLEPVLRAATGQTLEQYAQAQLWSKLGMTASWAHDPASNPTAYANVLASCRDHARLGYLYAKNGRWGTEQVVPAAWVAQSLMPSQAENRAYGFLWWLNAESPALDAMLNPWPGRMVPFAPKDLFAARGFGNQFIDVIPSLGLVVVRFGPDPAGQFDLAELTTDQHFATHDQILAAVLAAVPESS